MKRLILVRHAKTESPIPGQADRDRMLLPIGDRDAKDMGIKLAKLGYLPNCCLCSPAVRTRTTAQYILESMQNNQPELVINSLIYNANLPTLLSIIESSPEHYSTVMLVGHNPGITELTNVLSTQGVDNMPTCGVFIVDFSVESWENVAAENSHFVAFF